MSAAKTINDLPHFHVSTVKVAEKNTEYFELTGIFDRTEHVAEGRCSLLLPRADELIALPGYLEFQNQQERTGHIYTPSEKPPDVRWSGSDICASKMGSATRLDGSPAYMAMGEVFVSIIRCVGRTSKGNRGVDG